MYSGNRLTIKPGELAEPPIAEFIGVQELEIDDTLLEWPSICDLVLSFKDLRTLSASSNGLHASQLQTSLVAPGLASLTLEFNEFTALEDLTVLTTLPSLTSLLLKGNKICKVGLNQPVFGPALKYVDLSYNKVAEWSFVDELTTIFPGLTSLRISQNPLYPAPSPTSDRGTQELDDGFLLTIARIAKLQTLNFSNISTQDRTNAEMFYLSRITQEMAKVAVSEEGLVTSQHKRFNELCTIYGQPTVVRKVADEIDPNILEARLIKFTFYIPASADPASQNTDQPPFEEVIEIPKTFDTYRVKGIVGKRFRLRPMKLRLVWETEDFDPVAGFDDADFDDEEEEEGMDVSLKEAAKEKAKFIRREVELLESTRPIGNTIDGKEARVRIEVT